MKVDVKNWLERKTPNKLVSKETLNHPGIIHLASGLNPYLQTQEAFIRAYKSLGIDIINNVPLENAPKVVAEGDVIIRDDYQESYLGVFNSTSRIKYPFTTLEDFWKANISNIDYNRDLRLPGAQYLNPLSIKLIKKSMSKLGEVGIYYYQLYTTLFMWAIEYLGWEIFMLAAGREPERFEKHFLIPVFEKTKKLIQLLSSVDTPMVFCHDDIAMSTGPIFNPKWYKTYIFPRYKEIWDIAHNKGKKVFFVADGNLNWALEDIRLSGCDGIMFETPATSLERVKGVFGDSYFIGGIDVNILTFGNQGTIKKHVEQVAKSTRDYKGFAMCCSGGLNGNIPLENLETYFDKRSELGFTEKGWRCKSI